MNYEQNLEAQNEHLRAKLAEAQTLIDWRDRCRARRLQFHYEFMAIINTSDDTPGGNVSSRSVGWYVSRSLMKHVLHKIRSHPRELFDYSAFKHLKDEKIVYFSFYRKVGRWNEFKDPCVEVLVSSHMIYETHL